MLPLEHSAILLTRIKQQLVLKANFGFLYERPLKTCFTVLIMPFAVCITCKDLFFSFGEVYPRIYRYIVRYTVGKLVLRRRASNAVKRDFRTYILRYTVPNEKFEFCYPHSNARLQFRLKLKRCKPHKTARHPMICDVTNDVKLYPTVYHRIYFRKYSDIALQKQVH